MIYLDHAATTPLHPEARRAMEPFLERIHGNPSSVHAVGQEARRALDDARDRIAAALGALTGCFLGWLWFAIPLMRKPRQRGAH